MNQDSISVIHIAPQPDTVLTESYGTQCASYFNKTREIDYVGYLTDEEFIHHVDKFTATLETNNEDLWSLWNLSSFSSIIEESLIKASSSLRLPDMPVQVFLFPWSGQDVSLSDFGGVNALAPHRNVIHLFINPRYPDVSKSLKETIVHEFTHLFYYQTSDSSEYTLYEDIIMEGIAEVFREEVVGGLPAVWSTALDERQAKELLDNLSDQLSLTDEILRHDIMFGSEKYKKWSGYSTGYHLVKKWRKAQSDIKWEEFIDYLRTKQPLL